MFHLFSHCWTWLQAVQEPVRKVTLLVMGLDNSGKSSIITDIMRALASEVLPAAQPGQTRLRVNRFEVTLVELPGSQRCRSAWRSHYGAADGLLFVLDSSDLVRMEEARKALSRVLSHPDVSGKPLLLSPLAQGEEKSCSAEKIKGPQPTHHLLPPGLQKASAKGPGKRKKKVKVKKKGTGRLSPAEEPEGGAAGGADGQASTARGLLAPNKVGQEEPGPAGMAAPHPAQGMKKKKKKKIKNKIKSQEPAMEQQREEVSSTFDLYRRAMLALKMRQEQRKQPSAIAP
ncbi:ADP-ribosylation factor-like protein 13A [Cyrtonyx montezumae]|uniref:ADP-ribosylation factor-like protein 13A n=1 Tax=Cyrtonyx montezumae TaxID=9017 RepID=UPI0032DA3662